MQVPEEDYSETAVWALREKIKNLEAELTLCNERGQNAARDRDHWFETAKMSEKIILNLAQALNKDS